MKPDCIKVVPNRKSVCTVDEIEGTAEALVSTFVNIPGMPSAGDVWRKLLPPLRTRATPPSDENRVARITALAEGLAIAAWCVVERNVNAVFEAADKLTIPDYQRAQTTDERVELLAQALHLLGQWLLRSPFEAADTGVPAEALREIPQAALLRVRRAQ